jgi:hypothetical protein
MNETWIHIHDPEAKEQSKEWRQWFPASKKFKTQKLSSKAFVSLLWDKDGMLLVDYLERGSTITAKYCLALLDKLKQQAVSKRRGNLSKGIFVSSRQCCSS